jgi:hypothetical protein
MVELTSNIYISLLVPIILCEVLSHNRWFESTNKQVEHWQ